MTRPKVSVIIATHNHAHFLPECLASVRKQTYQDYEVLLIDNGSIDQTKEVVAKLSWDKLRYHYQSDTGSVAGPRNTGIRLAQGDYMAFLDSDDFWYDRKLEKTMQIFEKHPEVDIISHDLLWVAGEKTSPMKVGPAERDMFRALLSGNRLAGSATTVKKEAMLEVGGFDERKDYVHAEDYETWLRIAYKKKIFYFINECLGEYRVHKNNLSHDYETAFSNHLNVLRKHLKNYKSGNLWDEMQVRSRALARVNLGFAYKYFEAGKYKEAAAYALKSLLINPFYLERNIKLAKRIGVVVRDYMRERVSLLGGK